MLHYERILVHAGKGLAVCLAPAPQDELLGAELC